MRRPWPAVLFALCIHLWSIFFVCHFNKSAGRERYSEFMLVWILAAHVQNISREAESRDLLLASANAVRFLSDLLFASVAQCQAMHSFDSDDPRLANAQECSGRCALLGRWWISLHPRSWTRAIRWRRRPRWTKLTRPMQWLSGRCTDKTDTSVCLSVCVSVCVSARGVQGDALGLCGFWQHLLVLIWLKSWTIQSICWFFIKEY